jgi:hypothetical protein
LGFSLVVDPGKTVYIGTSLFSPGGCCERSIPLLTGYRVSDGALVSGVRPQLCCGGVPALRFSNGLIYSYESAIHGGIGQGGSAIHPDTGRVAWTFGGFPVAVAGEIVVETFDATSLSARDAVTGEPLWTMAPVFGGTAVAVANLILRYAAGDSIEVRRLSDGTVAGTFTPNPGQSISSVVPSGGQIFAVAGGRLFAIKPIA